MRLAAAKSRPLASKEGFTLLEMLLAVALGATLVTFMVGYLFSLAGLWGAGSNDRLFEKHARGVSRFLEQSFLSASSRIAESGNVGSPVHWMQWEGDAARSEAFLTFELEQSPGALVWPEEPMPHVVCSLLFDEDDGLFLLWRSRLEQDFDEAPPRKTLVSPFVDSVEYPYIDYREESPKWEKKDRPEEEADGAYLLPERWVLTFGFDGQEVRRQLIIPRPMEGLPIL